MITESLYDRGKSTKKIAYMYIRKQVIYVYIHIYIPKTVHNVGFV